MTRPGTLPILACARCHAPLTRGCEHSPLGLADVVVVDYPLAASA